MNESFGFEIDLMKAGSHKYVKRTGGPGNYKYWYKMPDGTIKQGKEEDVEHGKKDHARRLLIARLKGHHAMTDEQITQEVGITKKRLNEHKTNLRSMGKRKNPTATDDHMAHGHDYHEKHLKEAGAHTEHPDYESHARALAEHEEGTTGPSRRGGSRPRSAPAPTPAPAPAAPAAAPRRGPLNSEQIAEWHRQHAGHWTRSAGEAAKEMGFTDRAENGDTSGPHGNKPPDHLQRHVTGGVHTIKKVGDKFELEMHSQGLDSSVTQKFDTVDAAVAASKHNETGATARRTRAERPARMLAPKKMLPRSAGCTLKRTWNQ